MDVPFRPKRQSRITAKKFGPGILFFRFTHLIYWRNGTVIVTILLSACSVHLPESFNKSDWLLISAQVLGNLRKVSVETRL